MILWTTVADGSCMRSLSEGREICLRDMEERIRRGGDGDGGKELVSGSGEEGGRKVCTKDAA